MWLVRDAGDSEMAAGCPDGFDQPVAGPPSVTRLIQSFRLLTADGETSDTGRGSCQLERVESWVATVF